MKNSKIKAKSKVLKALSLVAIVFLTMLAVDIWAINQPKQDGTPQNGNGYFGLVPPPAHATDYGFPLDTSNITLFAYYYRFEGFQLNLTVPAWVNYTDHYTYYDGFIRTYIDLAGTSYTGGTYYIDVYCRLRADGWIMTWFRTTSKGYVGAVSGLLNTWEAFTPYFAGTVYSTAPVGNATSLMRAMNRIFYVAGYSFPAYTAIKMYDYSLPTATKLLIFGKNCSMDTNYFYAVIPSSTNDAILKFGVFVGAGNSVWVVRVNTVKIMENTYQTYNTSLSCVSMDSTITFQCEMSSTQANVGAMVWLN